MLAQTHLRPFRVQNPLRLLALVRLVLEACPYKAFASWTIED